MSPRLIESVGSSSLTDTRRRLFELLRDVLAGAESSLEERADLRVGSSERALAAPDSGDDLLVRRRLSGGFSAVDLARPGSEREDFEDRPEGSLLLRFELLRELRFGAISVVSQ